MATPYIALAVANLVFRKAIGIQNDKGFGYDLLSSSAALLPCQVGGLIALMLGVGNIELIIGVSVYSVVLASLITYSIAHSVQSTKANLVLFLTPVKIFIAAYLTKVIYAELLQRSF